MRIIAIILLVIAAYFLFWPSISKWLKRKAMDKAEDYLRASMGMPPREKKRRDKSSEKTTYRNRNKSNPFEGGYRREPIIPKEYAEDVEFIEIKEYSKRESFEYSNQESKFYKESQISDVEFTEVKKSGVK